MPSPAPPPSSDHAHPQGKLLPLAESPCETCEHGPIPDPESPACCACCAKAEHEARQALTKRFASMDERLRKKFERAMAEAEKANTAVEDFRKQSERPGSRIHDVGRFKRRAQ